VIGSGGRPGGGKRDKGRAFCLAATIEAEGG
jgi:hypothetical protein